MSNPNVECTNLSHTRTNHPQHPHNSPVLDLIFESESPDIDTPTAPLSNLLPRMAEDTPAHDNSDLPASDRNTTNSTPAI